MNVAIERAVSSVRRHSVNRWMAPASSLSTLPTKACREVPFSQLFILAAIPLKSSLRQRIEDKSCTHLSPLYVNVENPILEKVRSGGSGQTFALPAKKKVSELMEVASAPTYASILKKGLKWAPVTVHSF